jgi:hypothetical protein
MHGMSLTETKNVLPFDSCLFCTKKHLLQAWGAFTELGYEEQNLDYVASQLRLAVPHCQYLNRDLALKIRELSVDVEARKFDSTTEKRFEELLNAIQEEIYKTFPNIKDDFEKFKASNH